MFYSLCVWYMTTPIVVANISIVVLGALALSFFFNPWFYQDLVKEFSKSKVYVFIAGLINLVIWAAILQSFRAWNADWTVLVTIIWYSALVKWILLVLFPHRMIDWMKSMKMKKSMMYVYGLVCAAITICLIRSVYAG